MRFGRITTWLSLLPQAAKQSSPGSQAQGPFEPKLLQLSIVSVDARGKAAPGPPLGTLGLDLADYASSGGLTQQAFPILGSGGRSLAASGGAPSLLLTIG
jgi:hypothetical protein